jgi:hypothetical protein
MASELSKWVDTEWVGTGELWLDQLGNKAQSYECTLTVGTDDVSYTWQHEDKSQQGEYRLREDGSALWSDSWHQPEVIECRPVPGAKGLFGVECSYQAPGTPDWGWRMGLSQRPTGELVLQMTNITPWGEEGRAVRMVFNRKT